MKCQGLLVTLLDDVVFSASSATTGGHRGLDYIPGANLLGWAAGQIYSKLSGDDSFCVFHSGSVRFCNGLPLSETGQPAYPMPLCWHRSKREEQFIVGGQLHPEKIRNFQYDEFEPDVQPVQLQGNYVTHSGEVVAPYLRLRMKTAVNAMTGRAKDESLFGYEGLAAGQHYLARIEMDPDTHVSSGLFDRVIEQFDDRTIRLGRSRGAEYGRARCRLVELDDMPNQHEAKLTDGMWVYTVWLLSDAAVLDKTGRPTLYPDLDDLAPGLPPVKPSARQSFVRSRRYAPYNGKLRRQDDERIVISQGSVLGYVLDKELDIAGFAGGVGMYREAGLGRVWINPPVLEGSRPGFAAVPEKSRYLVEIAQGLDGGDPKTGDSYAKDIVSWVEAQIRGAGTRRDLDRLVEEWLSELEDLYRRGRRQHAISNDDEFGPGKSQWSLVLNAATRTDGDRESLRKELFEADGAICGSNTGKPDERWQVQITMPEGQTTFRDWLLACYRDKRLPGDDQDLKYAIGNLARSAKNSLSGNVLAENGRARQ